LDNIRTGEEQGSGDVVLRPGPCLTGQTTRAGQTCHHRSHTTALPVVADHPAEQVWRLPLAAFHPLQFFSARERWQRSATPLEAGFRSLTGVGHQGFRAGFSAPAADA